MRPAPDPTPRSTDAASFPGAHAGRTCPAYGEYPAQAFHALAGIPTLSCALLETRKEAPGWPGGALLLARCPEGGLVLYTDFGPARVDYRQDCERTPGWFPTYPRWLGALAGELAEHLDLRAPRRCHGGCATHQGR